MYDHMRETLPVYDAKFAAAIERAKGESLAEIEDAARKRATEGSERQVMNKRGELVTIYDAPSDRMLEIMLRAREPKRYAAHSKIEHSGTLQLSDAAKGELSLLTIEQPRVDRQLARTDHRLRRGRLPAVALPPPQFGPANTRLRYE